MREEKVKRARQIYLIRSQQYADSRSANLNHSNFNFSAESTSAGIQTSSFKNLSVDRVLCSQESVSSQAISGSDSWITVSNKHQKQNRSSGTENSQFSFRVSQFSSGISQFSSGTSQFILAVSQTKRDSGRSKTVLQVFCEDQNIKDFMSTEKL